jgi:hypothetical protein
MAFFIVPGCHGSGEAHDPSIIPETVASEDHPDTRPAHVPAMRPSSRAIRSHPDSRLRFQIDSIHQMQSFCSLARIRRSSSLRYQGRIHSVRHSESSAFFDLTPRSRALPWNALIVRLCLTRLTQGPRPRHMRQSLQRRPFQGRALERVGYLSAKSRPVSAAPQSGQFSSARGHSGAFAWPSPVNCKPVFVGRVLRASGR